MALLGTYNVIACRVLQPLLGQHVDDVLDTPPFAPFLPQEDLCADRKKLLGG